MLASKRVLSAPVKLSNPPPEGVDGSGATIFGFVDVRDIVSSFFKQGEGAARTSPRVLHARGRRARASRPHVGRGIDASGRRRPTWCVGYVVAQVGARNGLARAPCCSARRLHTPAPRSHRWQRARLRRRAPSELQGIDLKSMKMLQRMRILEEKGQSFAPLALKDLPIIGGARRGSQIG